MPNRTFMLPRQILEEPLLLYSLQRAVIALDSVGVLVDEVGVAGAAREVDGRVDVVALLPLHLKDERRQRADHLLEVDAAEHVMPRRRA